MGKASNLLARRRSAQQLLDKIMRESNKLNVIHYSCESFVGDPQDASRRITSIAVLNVASGEEESFSIHQIAEEIAARPKRGRSAQPEDPFRDYAVIERALLDQFYQYVSRHEGY